jgi:hypothetical protein
MVSLLIERRNSMDQTYAFLVVVAGVMLRLGIPILMTVLLVYLLSLLDKSWQKKALRDGLPSPAALARNIGCWDEKNCSKELRQQCGAYLHPETPCWQYFRSSSGELRESCLGCDIFRKAPIPIAP